MSSSSLSNSRLRRNSYGSSRFNSETRLGIQRPSLDSMRTTSKGGPPQQSEAETDYDSYYDDEDDDELEAEALLSKKHGEASEAPTGAKANPKKRGTTDQDVADEYEEQEKERKKKTRRKIQQTIPPDDLIKPKGLTVVRNGIASRFHGGDKKARYTNTTKSMAKYSRRLVSAYSDWMENMTGGLTLHETQWKLRSLGSKTQIKQYLADMRKSVRDEHVERVLGLEKAHRLLQQLDNYYNEEQQQQMSDVDDGVDDEHHEKYDRDIEDGGRGSTNPSTPIVTNPYSNNNNNNNNKHGAHSTEDGAQSVAITPTNTAKDERSEPAGGDDVQEQSQEEDPLQRRLRLQKEHRARRHVLEDSDDEEDEAVFDDVVSANPTGTNPSVDSSDDNDDNNNDSSTPARSSTTKVSRRHVLDDSDDDGNDGEKEGSEMAEDGAETNDHTTVEAVREGVADAETAGRVDTSKNTDDEFALGPSDVAATTPTNTSIEELNGKFESVKDLLEGGGRNSDEPTTPIREETEETREEQSEDGKIDASGAVQKDDHHDREDDPAPFRANIGESIDENVQEEESSSSEDKTEVGDDSSNDQQLARAGANSADPTTVDGDEQA